MRLSLLLLILAPLAVFAQSETPTREHYQPIVDAKPFGDVAKQVSAEEAAKAAEEQKQKEEIAQKFRMVGITDYPDGTRKIAFLDETQGVASYLLGIGESENGFTLIEADYDAEWATLTKDGLTFTLGLGKGLIEKPDPEEEAEPLTPLSPAARRVLPQAAAQSATAKPAAKSGSFSARLRRREAAKVKAEAERLRRREAAKVKAEAERREAIAKDIAAENAKIIQAQSQAQTERRLQIERIKRGLPPTKPITLTPAEDAELEAAGVFNIPEATPAAAPQEETPADAVSPANP